MSASIGLQSSNWCSSEYIPGTPFHGVLTVYFFQDPKPTYIPLPHFHTGFWQVQLFLNQTHVAVPRNRGVLCQSGELYLVGKKKKCMCFGH